MRSLVGASVPLWVTQLFHNLGFQYAGLFLALVSCVILVSPVLYFGSPRSMGIDNYLLSSQFHSYSSSSVDRLDSDPAGQNLVKPNGLSL